MTLFRPASRPARWAAAGVLLLLLGTAAGCGGGAGDTAASNAAGGSGSGGDVAAAAPARGTKAEAAADVDPTQAVVSKGSVELTATDVPDARLDVLTVVARYGGQVSDEQATTDPDAPGKASAAIRRTHLVVRVPSGDFDRAMRDLAAIGDFVASSRSSTDVTTKVIDTRARVRVQARSVARIETLLDRATDIRDIVAVEAQLSRRQADLESLQGRAAYLRDQTTLATITVDLSTPDAAARRPVDRSAFVGGLVAGWHGLTAVVGAGLATVGALLPFALVLLPLGLLLWWLRRRHPAGVVPDVSGVDRAG